YKATISEIDKFLLEIYTNVIALTKNETIKASNIFKGEKTMRTGTQLNTEFDIFNDNILKIYKNKKDIPKVSNLITEETQIAETFTKIYTANYCNLYNRALFKSKSRQRKSC
ncbi:27600_t:CDS:2, partial [Dentiscutata erythropus]